jgi:cell division protein FtsB
MQRSTSRRHLLFLGLLVACLLFILGYTGRLAEQARLQAEQASWEARIADAQQRQARLAAQLDYVRSDAYVHEQAREALNLVQPGDELVILVEQPPVQAAPAGSPATVEWTGQATPKWRQWLELFAPAQ